jgi:CAAX prenyl protease-like protein
MEYLMDTRREGLVAPVGRWYVWAPVWGLSCFLLSALVAIPVVLITGQGNPPIHDMARRDPGLLLAVLVLAPFVETFIGQWLPVAVVGVFRGSTVLKVTVSALLFASLHIPNSWANAIVILLVSGPILAYTFVRFRRESRWKAYFTTTVTHVINNFCAGLIILATPR